VVAAVVREAGSEGRRRGTGNSNLKTMLQTLNVPQEQEKKKQEKLKKQKNQTKK